jgi:hypothetical protein
MPGVGNEIANGPMAVVEVEFLRLAEISIQAAEGETGQGEGVQEHV